MFAFLKWALVAACMCVGVAAQAETVTGNGVNCRAAARTTAPVLGTLHRGDTVPVISSANGWSYVDPNDLPACYVRSDFLAFASSGYSSYVSPRSTSNVRSTRSTYRRGSNLYSAPRSTISRKRSSASSRRSGQSRGLYDSSSSCPCSGGSVCIGPRGGRYCITSGGNKRYGV